MIHALATLSQNDSTQVLTYTYAGVSVKNLINETIG